MRTLGRRESGKTPSVSPCGLTAPSLREPSKLKMCCPYWRDSTLFLPVRLHFYEILPYCYILGITEKLKKKFDRIIMDGPGWYLGELRDILMP